MNTTNATDYDVLTLDALQLLRLKLFGKALKQFPSSPRQKATHVELEKVCAAISKKSPPLTSKTICGRCGREFEGLLAFLPAHNCKYPTPDTQRGSILPEICWLFATLLLAALFIVPTVRHYDGELTARLNHSLDLRK